MVMSLSEPTDRLAMYKPYGLKAGDGKRQGGKLEVGSGVDVGVFEVEMGRRAGARWKRRRRRSSSS